MSDHKPWSRWRYVGFHLGSMRRSFFHALAYLVAGVPGPKEVPTLCYTPTSHPSDLCKCACGREGGTEDHEDGCLWRAAMCELCSGTGHCPCCWGDGCAEEGGCKVASHA